MVAFKHLTHEQRVLIEDRLNHEISIRGISKELEKSPSTILREIENHSTQIPSSKNNCKYRRQCEIHHLCNEINCKRLCSKCYKHCKSMCVEYFPEICSKLLKSPYICNSCRGINFCEYDKNIYKAFEAQKEYKYTLSDSRSGFDISEKDLTLINNFASPLIQNGLSPFHIKQSYKDDIPVSEATLRRMINKEVIDARNVDLRDKVKRKPRKTKDLQPLSLTKIGHFYADYLEFIDNHDFSTTEMDCVEGRKSDKATLLTLTIKNLSLQLAFIMNDHTAESVVSTLDKIEAALGYELFHEVFGLILTDNGSEFSDIHGMETSCLTGRKRTSIYFCEPNRSDEKGTCENHHKMIRYIIPKGTSLEPYYQSDISLMMNHINSYKRKALFGKSAYELAKTVLPEDFFILLGLEEIEPDKIILKPSLLNKTHKSK